MSVIQKLIDLQNIFKDTEDWKEVSKIQYQIDSLPPEKKPKVIETWFLNAFYWEFVIPVMKRLVSDEIEYMKRVVKFNGRK